jgi:hypothetical protein
MVVRFTDSWNRADGAAYGENYWPEAELVNPSGDIVNGRAAIIQEQVTPFGTGFLRGVMRRGRCARFKCWAQIT